jgi:hypothetical protein
MYVTITPLIDYGMPTFANKKFHKNGLPTFANRKFHKNTTLSGIRDYVRLQRDFIDNGKMLFDVTLYGKHENIVNYKNSIEEYGLMNGNTDLKYTLHPIKEDISEYDSDEEKEKEKEKERVPPKSALPGLISKFLFFGGKKKTKRLLKNKKRTKKSTC